MLVTWATPAPPSDCNRNFTVSGLLLFFSSIQIRFPGGLFLFVCFCFFCGHVSFPPAQSVPGFLLAREVLFGFVLISASLLDCELDRNLVCSAHGHVPIAAAVPDAEAARDGFSRRSEDFACCPQDARGGRKELLHNSRALFESLISSHLVTSHRWVWCIPGLCHSLEDRSCSAWERRAMRRPGEERGQRRRLFLGVGAAAPSCLRTLEHAAPSG
uniref:Uncharacterized protein n=1 Tax=Rousettus aegyptiacus TaxID=9407 RepID=A0A7J8JGT7_ROUAE|nr:hypothetical protein HJG63_010346 [Rousettus aegyptiacus]